MAGQEPEIRRTSLPMAGPNHQIRRTSRAMAGTETSNSPDLTAYGRPKHQIRRTSLPMAGPVRHTYVHPAGPPCLWPGPGHPLWDLAKLVNGGRGCSRRKHGYRKHQETAFFFILNLPLALYARVSSKPGEMWLRCCIHVYWKRWVPAPTIEISA